MGSTIAERLKELRLSQSLTQEAFAAKIHISNSHLSNLERGISNLPERLAAFIIMEFKVRREWLLHGEGSMLDYALIAKEKLHQVRDQETGERPELAVTMLSSRSAILEDIEANVLPASPDIYTSPLVTEADNSVCIDMICSILLKWQSANEYDRIKFEGQFDFLFPNFRTAVHERRQAVTQALSEQGMRIPHHSEWAARYGTGKTMSSLQYLKDHGFMSASTQDNRPVVIPVVGRAAAGLPIEMIEQRGEQLAVDGVRSGDFAVVATGTSMIDAGINDGDRVVIRPQPTVENGEIALVAVENGSTIKRFYQDDNCIRLVAANDAIPEQVYSHGDDVRVIGRVVRVLGKDAV